MTFNYDSAVITLILIADCIGVYMTWQCLQEKRKTKIRRIVNGVLQSLHLVSK